MSLNSLHNGNFGVLGGPWLRLYAFGGHYVGPHGCSSTRTVTKSSPKPIPRAKEGFRKKANSIAFGKSTSQTIYREQHTPKIGWKLHKYRLKHALHTLDDHFR